MDDLADLQRKIEQLIEDSESYTSVLDKDMRDYAEGKEDAYYEVLAVVEKLMKAKKESSDARS